MHGTECAIRQLTAPAYMRYVAQLNERTYLKHEIADAPTIDPVHAAGACYCRECKHWQEPYDYCKEFAAERNQGDFCSYGKRRED